MIFPNLASIIAEETNGDYTFEHVDQSGYNTLYLKKLGKVIMYDMTNRPLKDIYEPHLDQLTGDVLICGLGCGFSVFPIKDLPAVDSVTVIESDQDIIDMMTPYLAGVTIIQADAKSYIPTTKYDSIFLDIWDDNNTIEKYSHTLRYQSFLKFGGYLNYLDFERYYDIKSSVGVAQVNSIQLPEDPFRYYGQGQFFHLIDDGERLFQEHWKTGGPGTVTGQMRTTLILPSDFSSFLDGAIVFDVMKDNDPATFTLTIFKNGVADPSVDGLDIKSQAADLTWEAKTLPLTGTYSAGDELFIEFESSISTDNSGNEVDRFKLCYNTK